MKKYDERIKKKWKKNDEIIKKERRMNEKGKMNERGNYWSQKTGMMKQNKVMKN